MDAAKQRQVLDAVLKEFAQHGYANASTNRMVQEAGISKGMLFYYFKNKEELFRYALEYSLNYLNQEYVGTLDFSEPDFIVRFTKITEAKMRAYLKNPLPFTLLANLQINQDAKEMVPDVLKSIEEMRSNELSKLFANVDISLFREDVEAEHVLNLIRWSFAGYTNELITQLENKNLVGIDWEPYVKDFYEFLGVLRKILYKEGDHGDFTGQ